MRIGTGYDLHRLENGRPLVLGGITIPFDKGLKGHSDGDALAHAITDALFGAAGMGNIGTHFPDTEAAFKGADSLVMLSEAIERIRDRGLVVVNVDSTIIAEAPKLSPYVDAMRERLAAAMSVPIEQVSVKPKTNEGMGPEGRGEAMAVHAVVLLDSPA